MSVCVKFKQVELTSVTLLVTQKISVALISVALVLLESLIFESMMMELILIERTTVELMTVTLINVELKIIEVFTLELVTFELLRKDPMTLDPSIELLRIKESWALLYAIDERSILEFVSDEFDPSVNLAVLLVILTRVKLDENTDELTKSPLKMVVLMMIELISDASITVELNVLL